MFILVIVIEEAHFPQCFYSFFISPTSGFKFLYVLSS